MSTSDKGKKTNPKKGKSLIKLITKSDSDTDDSEHELSYYLDDRVKMMKEVMKIIKPKKIRSMAPKWMRSLDIKEINAMLFEELLGISNKRLKGIFNGQKQEDDSSSTDPEEEKQKPIDVISLDDISDDDFIINLDSDEGSTSKHKKVKVKEESKRKKVKKEKRDRSPKKSKNVEKEKTDEQNLMSVLELLELQARARAIRSQLALENKRKAELRENATSSKATEENSDNEDAVIIESPRNIEIVITSTESESEETRKTSSTSGFNQRAGSSKETDQLDASLKHTVSRQVESNLDRSDVIDKDTHAKGQNNEKNKVTSDENANSDQASINRGARQGDSLNGEKSFQIEDEASSSIQATKTDKAQSSKIQIQKICIFRKGQVPDESDSTIVNNENNSDDRESTNTVSIDTKDVSSNKEIRTSETSEDLANKGDGENGGESLASEEKLSTNITSSKHTVLASSEPQTGKVQGKTHSHKIRTFRKRRKSNESDSKSENESDVNSKTKKAYPDEQPGTSGISEKLSERQYKSVIDSGSLEENDGIVINVDESEIECITSD